MSERGRDTGRMDEATRIARSSRLLTRRRARDCLGVSMVHGLAAQLGGELRLSSEPGLGTRIELWLPVSSDARAEAGAARGNDGTAGSGIALLVDDEEMVRNSTSAMLADLGYRVVESASAEDALEQLRRPSPDILITSSDACMTGAELARLVKPRIPTSDPHNRALPRSTRSRPIQRLPSPPPGRHGRALGTLRSAE